MGSLGPSWLPALTEAIGFRPVTMCFRDGLTSMRGGPAGLLVSAGAAGALAIAFAIFKLGAKLNMRRFFQVLGIVLMVFAAGLLSDAVENLQQLRWLPFGTHVMWNSSGLITESSSFGDVLHSLVGYADRPTVLQVVVWIAYVVTSIALFVHLGRDRRPATPPRATPDAAPAKNETRHLPT